MFTESLILIMHYYHIIIIKNDFNIGLFKELYSSICPNVPPSITVPVPLVKLSICRYRWGPNVMKLIFIIINIIFIVAIVIIVDLLI